MRKYKIVYLVPIIALASCFSKTDEQKGEKTKAPTVKYNLATVQEGGISSIIKLPGQIVAYQEVSISPKVNGYVKKVMVDIGSKVTKGSILMTLEAPELQQAVVQAKEKFLRSKADFLNDKERYNRLLEASKTEGAISPMDLSTVKAKMASDSALSNAEMANWQAQQSITGYLSITAPFTGIITERNASPGALVSAAGKDNPMLELKEIDHLRLQIDVPESISSTLHEGDEVTFLVSSLKGKKMIGKISRKSSNINTQFRAERMEVDIDNKNGELSAGMYADVLINSGGNSKAMFVPKTAIVTSTERKYVLVIRDGKTTKVDVTTGNDDASKTEVYGLLERGEKVISDANDEIKENIPVE